VRGHPFHCGGQGACGLCHCAKPKRGKPGDELGNCYNKIAGLKARGPMRGYDRNREKVVEEVVAG
jgi:hypothetical protein